MFPITVIGRRFIGGIDGRYGGRLRGWKAYHGNPPDQARRQGGVPPVPGRDAGGGAAAVAGCTGAAARAALMPPALAGE